MKRFEKNYPLLMNLQNRNVFFSIFSLFPLIGHTLLFGFTILTINKIINKKTLMASLDISKKYEPKLAFSKPNTNIGAFEIYKNNLTIT